MYRFQVHGSEKIKLSARLQCTNGTPFAINLSLYPCTASSSSGPMPGANANPKRARSDSGVYTDATCGVTLPETEIALDGNGSGNGNGVDTFCLIPSTFSPGECSQFRLQVFYSGRPSSLSFLDA